MIEALARIERGMAPSEKAETIYQLRSGLIDKLLREAPAVGSC